MDHFIIREVQASEIDACTEVIRQSFLTIANEFGLTKENCQTNGAFIENERLISEKQKGHLMFALHLKDEIVGFVALEDKQSGVFALEKLSVLLKYRHLGYGKALLDFAKSMVLSLDGHKIIIGIIEENVRLKRWYEQYGFIHTGTKVFPHLPFTVGFMALNINCAG